MGMYYLDIETTGLDPRRSQIVTIQYQRVARDGGPGGALKVLKSWESDERTVLESFAKGTRFFDDKNPWGFFPTGFNLGFEYRFLIERMRHHKMDPGVSWDFALQKPSLDLKPVAILMNGGAFKGASLEHFSPKPTSGHRVIEALKTQDWAAVEEYIHAETAAFFQLLQGLHAVMPTLWNEQLQPLLLETDQESRQEPALIGEGLDVTAEPVRPKSPSRNPSS